MRIRIFLTALCLTAALGCRPRLDGAKCDTSANCPRRQYCSDEGVCVEGVDPNASAGGGQGGSGGGSTGGGTGTGGGSGGGTTGDAGVALQFNELTAAAGRLQGGTMTLDFQVGHSTPRTKMTGGSMELHGTAAVQR